MTMKVLLALTTWLEQAEDIVKFLRLLGEQEGLLPDDFLVLLLELDEFIQFFLHDFAFLFPLNLLLFLFKIQRVQLDWLG